MGFLSNKPATKISLPYILVHFNYFLLNSLLLHIFFLNLKKCLLVTQRNKVYYIFEEV